MLALALHPNIDIRNLQTPPERRHLKAEKDRQRGPPGCAVSNQRMHEQDRPVRRPGGDHCGRNMADEYFDYNHTYNFRDRDMLVLGPVVARHGGRVSPLLVERPGGAGGEAAGKRRCSG